MARTGRRPGPSTTRAEILRAARHQFATGGYDATTMRGVAEAAGVDSALVVRAFGGKAGLFRAGVEWPWNPADVVPAVAAGPKGATGRRIATKFVETWEHPEERAPIITLIRSAAAHAESRDLLNQFVTNAGAGPDRAHGRVRPRRGARRVHRRPPRRHRAGPLVLAIEPLASMEASRVRDVVASVVQRILTVPLP
jgi:AcrR family transcriptional regulator